MTFDMKLQEFYFKKIKNGEKIYEIRLNDEKRKLLKKGDKIIFSCDDDKIECEIDDLIYFSSFKEMIGSLPPKDIGFADATPEQIEGVYRGFYSFEDERKFGVVAIKIKLTK